MEIFTASTKPVKEECLRLVKEADVFVGIIARKYGWEPDAEKSITEMEYDAAKASEIDCLMFKIDPALPVNIEHDFDSSPDKWDKQKKLENFINRFSDDQMPALFKETTLYGVVIQSLTEWKEKKEQKPVVEEVSLNKQVKPTSKLNNSIEIYRKKVEALHCELPVAGFITQITVPIDIEDVFVPLHAMVDLRGFHENGSFPDASHAEEQLRDSDGGLEISLLEAFYQTRKRNQRGIVILGDPGSGKTTHLKRLLLYCLRESPVKLHLDPDMLPVFLPLRELDDLNQGIDVFIQKQLSSRHLNTLPVLVNICWHVETCFFYLMGLMRLPT